MFDGFVCGMMVCYVVVSLSKGETHLCIIFNSLAERLKEENYEERRKKMNKYSELYRTVSLELLKDNVAKNKIQYCLNEVWKIL